MHHGALAFLLGINALRASEAAAVRIEDYRDTLREAVAASGYPLQVLVQEKLANDYYLQPEWGFRDRFTGDTRAIDLYAHRELCASEDVYRIVVVRPTLDLIIECKRSSLPWLLFRDQRKRVRFPLVMGLHSDDIAIKTDDDRSTWSLPILMALGLSDHEFVTEDARASTFAGGAWAGKGKIRLTGSETYLGSVMPLRSALLQLEESLRPRSTYAYFWAALAIGLVVLDAPRIGVSVGADGSLTLEKGYLAAVVEARARGGAGPASSSRERHGLRARISAAMSEPERTLYAAGGPRNNRNGRGLPCRRPYSV